MDIYSFPTFNLTKILMTAEEAGASYTLHLIDPAKGEHKTPAHLARHPLGKVPAIEVNGNAYFESNAICRYIADKYAPHLLGATPEERLTVNQWVDYVVLHVGHWLQVVLFEERIGPEFFRAAPNIDAIKEAKDSLQKQLPVLEAQLVKQQFLARDTLSLADLIAAAFFETIKFSSVNIEPYQSLTEWLNTIRQSDCYLKANAKLPGGGTFARMLTANE